MCSVEWYTSGERVEEGSEQFRWSGDGTDVEGVNFWLSDSARAREGDQILYGTLGGEWGWVVGQSDNLNVPIRRPYICEISKNDIYRILEEDRGFCECEIQIHTLFISYVLF